VTRYEIKLVGAARDYRRVISELALLPAVLREHHPTRIVQSVYLDTPNGRALQDNLAGISERQKIRFRWYGPETERVRGRLERKRRSNALGDKDVIQIAEPQLVAGQNRCEFTDALRTALPEAAREWLHGLEPAQWIRYRRDYFATPGGELRVTVDRDLVAFDQRYDFVLSCRRPTPLPQLLIVEVKADMSQRDAIEEWLQHVDLRPSKCSKFVVASSPGEAPMASRFA